MDLLKREMERKKKALQEAKKKAGGGSGRYVKAGDLRRQQEEEEERLARQQQQQQQQQTKQRQDEDGGADHEDAGKEGKRSLVEADQQKPLIKKKRKKDKAALSRGSEEQHAEDSSSTEQQQQQQDQQQSLAQVKKQLRAMGLPVTLFGERGLADRRQRLQDAERALRENQMHRSEADEFRLGRGHGIRNPFLEKDSTDEAVRAAQAEAAADLKPSVPAAAPAASESTARDNNNKKEKDDNDDDHDDPHKRVYKHYKGLLKQWESDLNARTDEVKRSVAGRNETKTLKQCKDYIRPLFQQCKRRQLEENMLHKLLEMVEYSEQGEFVRANDAYMDLAIGRSAWPIGVTQVGIHSRGAREKIGSANVAHVMNSELQRKYLTSVKRLLTYEQKKRTDVDPSKKVT